MADTSKKESNNDEVHTFDVIYQSFRSTFATFDHARVTEEGTVDHGRFFEGTLGPHHRPFRFVVSFNDDGQFTHVHWQIVRQEEFHQEKKICDELVRRSVSVCLERLR